MKQPTSAPLSRAGRLAMLFGVVAALLLGACGSSDDKIGTVDEPEPADEIVDRSSDEAAEESEESGDGSGDVVTTDESADGAAAGGAVTGGSAVDVGLFFDGALSEEVTTENCTLSGGVETTCFRITVAGFPVSHDIGPFCPSTISDGAEAGGLWWDGEALYELDGAFIAGLAERYDDDRWRMYDEDGNVQVTETAEEFDLAARPDVDPSVQNHCVEGRLEWLENGEPVPTTVLIPVEPILADAPSTSRGNSGVTLDGVVIAAAAPVDAILGAYTIAAFDDCGAHFNPVDGYHLHGAVGCSELDEVSDGETPMFGYAMDGFPIHSPLDDPDSVDLDECNGHSTEADGYHYHANSAEQNQVVECLVGQTVAADDGAAGGRPPRDG